MYIILIRLIYVYISGNDEKERTHSFRSTHFIIIFKVYTTTIAEYGVLLLLLLKLTIAMDGSVPPPFPSYPPSSTVFRPHKSDDWQRYRPIIEQLYRHDQLKLKDVKKYMERNYNFVATYRNPFFLIFTLNAALISVRNPTYLRTFQRETIQRSSGSMARPEECQSKRGSSHASQAATASRPGESHGLSSQWTNNWFQKNFSLRPKTWGVIWSWQPWRFTRSGAW